VFGKFWPTYRFFRSFILEKALQQHIICGLIPMFFGRNPNAQIWVFVPLVPKTIKSRSARNTQYQIAHHRGKEEIKTRLWRSQRSWGRVVPNSRWEGYEWPTRLDCGLNWEVGLGEKKREAKKRNPFQVGHRCVFSTNLVWCKNMKKLVTDRVYLVEIKGSVIITQTISKVRSNQNALTRVI
jgi:hypothetical protein